MKAKKYPSTLQLALSGLICLSLSACNTSFGATASQGAEPLVIQASIQSSTSGRSINIPQAQLPQALQEANEVKIALDNSNNVITATRNADQSLSFALSQSVKTDSNGNIQALLIADGLRSFFLTLKTGALLALNPQGIEVSPTTQVLKGSRITLKAALQQPELTEDYDFTWFYSASASGPWTPIAGSGLSTTWEVPQAGNYYVRLDMQQKSSALSSTYITPSALITVKESDAAITSEPASGELLLGDVVQVEAHPQTFGFFETEATDLSYRWAYAQSPQGPFVPIEEEGRSIVWEPPAVGAYYLRAELRKDQELVASYVNSKVLIKVANSNQFVKLSETEVTRGESLLLNSNLALPPNKTNTTINTTAENLSYSWFSSPSPQGPFSLLEGDTAQIRWYPENTGQFYVRMKTQNTTTGDTRTYTSSKALLTVTDSNTFLSRTPANGQIARGASVQLQLNQPLENVTWSYGSSAQGPFVVIPGSGSRIQWVPSQAGSYSIRAEGTDASGHTVAYTSANTQIFVSDRDDIIVIDPGSASLNLGGSVQIKADLPEEAGAQYFWSYGTSANGPWSAVAPLDDRFSQKSLRWIPTRTGNFFLKVDVNNPRLQSTVSFVSPTPKVFVEERTPFFKTSPDPAFIGIRGAVTLYTSFSPENQNVTYAWSYSPSTAGPFTAMGGTTLPQIVWREPGLVGSYYIKLDTTLSGSSQVLSFVSQKPLVFVSSGTQSQPSFGVSGHHE